MKMNKKLSCFIGLAIIGFSISQMAYSSHLSWAYHISDIPPDKVFKNGLSAEGDDDSMLNYVLKKSYFTLAFIETTDSNDDQQRDKKAASLALCTGGVCGGQERHTYVYKIDPSINFHNAYDSVEYEYSQTKKTILQKKLTSDRITLKKTWLAFGNIPSNAIKSATEYVLDTKKPNAPTLKYVKKYKNTHYVKQEDIHYYYAYGEGKNIKWSPNLNQTGLENAYAHFLKHKSEFPEYRSLKEYVDAANQFVKAQQGFAFKRRGNDTLFYNATTNIFIAYKRIPQTVSSMFRPSNKKAHWDSIK